VRRRSVACREDELIDSEGGWRQGLPRHTRRAVARVIAQPEDGLTGPGSGDRRKPQRRLAARTSSTRRAGCRRCARRRSWRAQAARARRGHSDGGEQGPALAVGHDRAPGHRTRIRCRERPQAPVGRRATADQLARFCAALDESASGSVSLHAARARPVSDPHVSNSY